MDDLRESSQAEARRGSEMRRRDNCGRHLNRHGRPKGGTRQAGRGVEQVWTLWRTPDRKGTCKYDFNRRILKTVSPVVWEGAGAQSPVLDPITTRSVPWYSRLLCARLQSFCRTGHAASLVAKHWETRSHTYSAPWEGVTDILTSVM